MCGIAGVWSSVPQDTRALASRLDAALAHRGPDGAGHVTVEAERLLLAHRRLAIIDPSAAAAQPMRGAHGDLLVFNGEIYNHQALRAQLQAHGVRFATNSDTEVVMQWLAHHGPEELSALRGMFAFAFWDARRRSLLLARDRFGIKPLYFAECEDRLVFASEIRALLRSGLVAGEASAAGVLAFLQWGSIAPPLTWIDGVRAIEPGEWREWSAPGQSRGALFADRRCVWRQRDLDSESDSDFIARTRAALADSVAAHLVADVPVGAFLSGGLDSAAVVGLATAQTAGTLHTYTVAVDQAAFAEQHEARDTARVLGTTHHELFVDAKTVVAHVPGFLACIDAPTIDGLNSYLVSKAVAATGVKAVLSGIGGDEVFGGYPSFTRIPRFQRTGRLRTPLARGAALVGRVAASRVAERWRYLASRPHDIVAQYRALRGFLMPHEITTIGGNRLHDASTAHAAVAALDERRFSPVHPESTYAAIARMESVAYMTSQLLRDADVTSMAHGLELRVPFADHELISAVWPRLGQRPELLRRKRLLAEAMATDLPADVRTRRKRGFVLPVDRWLRGELGAVVKDHLHSLEAAEWIAHGAADRVWHDWQQGRAHWTRPWGLAVLGALCRQAA